MLSSDKKFVLEEINQNFGVDLSGYKSVILEKKVEAFQNNFGQEVRELKELLSIQTSEFFRDREMFDVLEKNILPQIKKEKEKKNAKIIRFWSAGCAAGEETYSLSILLKAVFGSDLDNFVYSVTGTDMSEKALLKAKKGEYHIQRVGGVPNKFQHNFVFDEKKVKVNEELKDKIRFLQHDLLNDEFPTHFDLISFRNVGIYLSSAIQEKLILKFYNSLNQRGFFILGKTETMPLKLMDLFEIVDLKVKNSIYIEFHLGDHKYYDKVRKDLNLK